MPPTRCWAATWQSRSCPTLSRSTTIASLEAAHGQSIVRRVLFSVFRENGWRPALLSLDTKEWQLVGSGRAIGGGAQYFPTGHLVHAQSEGLVAQPFDLERATLGGSPIPLLERLAASRFRTAPLAVAADAGALVYLPAARDPPERTLVRRP